jgi:hypothetical protein
MLEEVATKISGEQRFIPPDVNNHRVFYSLTDFEVQTNQSHLFSELLLLLNGSL